MTAIAETSPATTSAPQTQTDKTENASATATAAADFKNFLTLLTAQLRHQDPLSPLDSTQFVQQLASFSAVEQQIETNKLLRELMGDSTKSAFESAATWIGKEVEAETPQAVFNGDPITLRLPVGPEGATGEIVVRSGAGSVVYRQKVTAGQADFIWNGKGDDGMTSPEGTYKFAVEYVKDGETAGAKLLTSSARVIEVRLAGDEAQLSLENGAVIGVDDVIALREPSDVLPGNV